MDAIACVGANDVADGLADAIANDKADAVANAVANAIADAISDAMANANLNCLDLEDLLAYMVYVPIQDPDTNVETEVFG